MKIICMGTPQFALPAFERLQELHQIIAVYTQPPRPAGRGHNLQKTLVHEWAEQSGLPVFTPLNFKQAEEREKFKVLGADLAVVAAYGLILPEEVLQAPKFGCINIHSSILPKYRGAAPIHRALLNDDEVTGVSIMQMDKGCDTGPVFATSAIPINDDTTFPELHDQLASIGADLLLEVLDKLARGEVRAVAQDNSQASYAAKVTNEDRLIDWQRPGRLILRQINCFTSKPGAYFNYQGEGFKILKAKFIESAEKLKPGSYCGAEKGIACQDGFILPLTIQRQGKQAVAWREFLNGFSFANGTVN